MKRITITACLFLFMIGIFLHPETAILGIASGLQVCVHTILPILFPFIVLSNIWISLGYDRSLTTLISPLFTKFFHLPGRAASAFLLGILGGYPIGVKTVAQLYAEGQLTKTEAEATVSFTNNAGPAFLIAVIGYGLFQQPMIGAVIWGIQIISAIVIGCLLQPDATTISHTIDTGHRAPSVLHSISKSINQAGSSSINICIYVLFFSILTKFLTERTPQSVPSTIIISMLELTSGSKLLATLGISQELLFVICTAIAVWGGLCVHCQTISILEDCGLSQSRYWFGKLLQTILSGAIACLLSPFINLSAQCLAFNETHLIQYNWMILIIPILLLLKSSSGKTNGIRI